MCVQVGVKEEEGGLQASYNCTGGDSDPRSGPNRTRSEQHKVAKTEHQIKNVHRMCSTGEKRR